MADQIVFSFQVSIIYRQLEIMRFSHFSVYIAVRRCHTLPVPSQNRQKKLCVFDLFAKILTQLLQLPLPKGDILRNGTIRGAELDYSRWMQNLIGILDVDIIFKENNELGPDPVITMLLDLGYRNKGDREDDWKRIANSTESRRMDCDIKTVRKQIARVLVVVGSPPIPPCKVDIMGQKVYRTL